MTTKKYAAHLRKLDEQMSLENRNGDLRRARAVTVGTSFGGTTEIMMRGNDGSILWTPMQPVEVIELIHQLAANVGCHINLQPRKDFSSWREWKVTEEERLHLQGHPPFPNDMAPHVQVGSNLPPPEQQPGLKIEVPIRSEENVVATKKTVNGRNVKRTPKTS